MSDAQRRRGRPRKHPLPEAQVTADDAWAAIAAASRADFARAMAEHVPEPACTGRVRWKGSSGAHPRTALQVAWQCAGGIEWRHIEVVGPDAPDTEDAP
jgi:hypothetical protein